MTALGPFAPAATATITGAFLNCPVLFPAHPGTECPGCPTSLGPRSRGEEGDGGAKKGGDLRECEYPSRRGHLQLLAWKTWNTCQKIETVLKTSSPVVALVMFLFQVPLFSLRFHFIPLNKPVVS